MVKPEKMFTGEAGIYYYIYRCPVCGEKLFGDQDACSVCGAEMNWDDSSDYGMLEMLAILVAIGGFMYAVLCL